ncbi:hypothetical protein CLI81_04070 [Porphyromonas gingivalis]|nr:hypothetical protein CLI81_04070 [Porphyromonas gingivalis]
MPKSILCADKNTTSEGKKNTPMTGFPIVAATEKGYSIMKKNTPMTGFPPPIRTQNQTKKRTAIRYSGSPYVEVYLIRSKRLSEANRSFSAEKPERY